MALTAAEQKELEGLEAEFSSQPTSGLTAAEQAELQALEAEFTPQVKDPGSFMDTLAAASVAIPQAGLALQQVVTDVAASGKEPQEGAKVAKAFQQALNQETLRIFNETGDFQSAIEQARKNVIQAGIPDPSVMGIEDLRRSQASVARQLGGGQAEIAERSPVGQFVGETIPEAVIAAPIAAGAGIVGGSALFGGASKLLEPQQETLPVEGALQEKALDVAFGTGTGALFGKGLQLGGKVITKSTPLIAEKVTQAASTLDDKFGGVLADSVNKLLKINPAAARDALDIGVASSVAQVSDRTTIKLLDRFLSKFPFAAETLKNNGLQTIEKIENEMGRLGAKKAVSTQEVGEVLQEGATRFVGRFRDISNRLYGSFFKAVPKDSKFTINNVEKFVANETAKIANAPAAQTDLFKTQAFNIVRNMQDDALANGGKLPFNLVKHYRTKVGEALNDRHILGTTDQNLMNGLYKSLSDDMRAAAEVTSPQAVRAFERANNFYAAGAKKIENRLQKVINSDVPEDVMNILLSGTKRGGTRINSIMKSLNQEERDIVVGTVLRDMGRAPAGQQGAAGDLFSINTMLTNWNKISPEAKIALFGKAKGEMRQSLDKIARIAERLKEVNRFANPSGTAQAVTTGIVSAGLFFEPFSVITGLGGSVLGAKLLTNPKFVKWLATNSTRGKINKQILSTEINKLATLAKQSPQIAPEIQQYINAIGVNATNRGLQNGGNI